MALLLGVLLNIFAGGVRGADITGQYVHAIQVAESVLASVDHDVPLQGGALDGVTDDIYHWRLVVLPYTPPEAGWQPEKSPYQAYHVRVEVQWGAPPGQRQFALDTLRLATADKDGQGRGGR